MVCPGAPLQSSSLGRTDDDVADDDEMVAEPAKGGSGSGTGEFRRSE